MTRLRTTIAAALLAAAALAAPAASQATGPDASSLGHHHVSALGWNWGG